MEKGQPKSVGVLRTLKMFELETTDRRIRQLALQFLLIILRHHVARIHAAPRTAETPTFKLRESSYAAVQPDYEDAICGMMYFFGAILSKPPFSL